MRVYGKSKSQQVDCPNLCRLHDCKQAVVRQEGAHY